MVEKGIHIALVILQHRGEGVALFLRHPNAQYAHIKQAHAAVFLKPQPPINADRVAAIGKFNAALHNDILLLGLRFADHHLLVRILTQSIGVNFYDELTEQFFKCGEIIF